MSSTPRRIGVLMVVFAIATLAVLLQLGWLMLGQNELWTLRSYNNRWTFRDVPTHRGAIADRFGNVLVADAPSFELLVDYQAFRRYHPVGAAVHGATLLADYTPALAGVRYTYGNGPRGPEAACRALLELPLAWLRRRGGGQDQVEDRRDVRFYCVSLLSHCTHRSRSRIYKELRQAENSESGRCVGQAVPGWSPAELAQAFARGLAELRAADRELAAGAGHGELLQRLDRYRDESYAPPGEGRQPDPSRLRPLADRVTFDLAAGLRTLASDHPGLWLEPTVVREPSELAARYPLVRAMLGSVKPIDRLVGFDPDDTKQQHDAKYRQFLDDVEARRDEIIGARELQTVVPEDVASEEIRDAFRKKAQQYVEAIVRNGDRHGSSGVEQAMDAVLAGDPGLRLVERDKRAREQKLWSRLEVRPGDDVRLSLDLDLQLLAQQVLAEVAAEWSGQLQRASNRERALQCFGAAVAILDASSGEVLAVCGLPDDTPELRGHPLGLNWRVRGDIGSVAKPFVALEQLQAESQGRPHKPLAEFVDCHGNFDKDRHLSCLEPHRHGGRQLVPALEESCNAFFFQAAEGLGQDGLQRALRRFGLLQPADAAEPAFALGTWQPRPIGVSWRNVVPPTVGGHFLIEKRAIGYGVEASVVMVARAYAALGTGVLREATLVRGGGGAAVELDVTEAQLQQVRDGLRGCVTDGTARKVPLLAAYGVLGKTGTAEVDDVNHDNNALFAGYLPYQSADGVQLAFCAAVYFVPNGSYGGEVAGGMLATILDRIAADPVLQARYQLQRSPGR